MAEDYTETGDLVLDFVVPTIRAMESWKSEPGTPASMDDVEALLGNDVPRGPADVTSIHDFYTLSIAFEHIWEERFGNSIGELAQDLYSYIVSEKDTEPESHKEQLFAFVPPDDSIFNQLDDGVLTTWLRQQFFHQGEELSAEVKVEVQQTGSAWTIVSGEDNYLLTKEHVMLVIYRVTTHIYGLADVERLLAEARSVLDQRVAMAGVPKAVKDFLPEITAEMWGALGFEGRRDLLAIVIESQISAESSAFSIDDEFGVNFFEDIEKILDNLSGYPPNLQALVELGQAFAEIEAFLTGLEGAGGDPDKLAALRLIQEAVESTREIVEGDRTPLIAKVAEALKEPHAFKIYAADSVNFGVLLNYRQEWDPQTYQVGELINTIPLAPKEVRKYTKKQIYKESRKRKEVNNALSIRRGDTSQTGRAESEIVNRANENTSFNASASVSGTIGVVGFNGSTNLNANCAKDSARTKKNFREAVTKSAQELKNEQKLEVELSTASDFEDTTAGEISNPNEEIAVTYLFYELQRRYKVNEYLHDATPVILVANDVPNPDEIDEAWLLRYEWILRRVILDDEFLLAFNLLKKARSGKNIETDTLRTQVEHQLRAFQDTKIELETYTKSRSASERELRAAVERYADAVNADKSTIEEMGDTISNFLTPGGVFGSVHEFFLGSKGTKTDYDAEKPEAAQARQEAVEEALARIDRSITDTRLRLEGISTALNQAIDKYMTAVRTRLDGELALMKLRVHVKDNILYYMQAIWDHEPPDQRYFRLCDVLVPTLENPYYDIQVMFSMEALDDVLSVSQTDIPQMVADDYFITLKEVADLDNLLGYKGNYMIFPLVAPHPVTNYMMQDYVDEYGRVRDPDQSPATSLKGPGSAGLLHQFVEQVYREQGKAHGTTHDSKGNGQKTKGKSTHDIDPEVKADYDSKIQKFFGELFKDELSDEIVVPSDLLFIAALTGTHPLLEDFKLNHRGLDVLKAAAELEEMQVDIIRKKARLLNKDLDDPEIDKRVVIAGDNFVVPAADVAIGEAVSERGDGQAAPVQSTDGGSGTSAGSDG